MAKFNVIQKQRREKMQELKRAIHGEPHTGKLKNKPQNLSISGKKKRKLFKKWRREQKEAIKKGLITMQDVEMAVAEGTSEEPNSSSDKTPVKLSMKKGRKLQIKRLKGKGKNKKKSSEPAKGSAVDAMVE